MLFKGKQVNSARLWPLICYQVEVFTEPLRAWRSSLSRAQESSGIALGTSIIPFSARDSLRTIMVYLTTSLCGRKQSGMRILLLFPYQHLLCFSKGLKVADDWHWRDGVRSNGPLHPSGIESALAIVPVSRKTTTAPTPPPLVLTTAFGNSETFSCLGLVHPSGRSASHH